MDKEEIKQIAYDYTTCKADAIKLEDRILSLFNIVQSDYLCDRECSGENKCDEQCYICADMEKL